MSQFKDAFVTPQFKDAFGTPLCVGDIVAHLDGVGRATSPAPYEVVGFTPKMVRLRRIKLRSAEPLLDRNGTERIKLANEYRCIRIDVKAYLGLAS